MKPDKSKATSVVLAIFLSFWTWLYTYKYDSWKFWVGLGLSFIGLFMAFLPNLAVWIWAIIDSANKNQKALNKYY